jgi:hypothetical protein
LPVAQAVCVISIGALIAVVAMKRERIFGSSSNLGGGGGFSDTSSSYAASDITG